MFFPNNIKIDSTRDVTYSIYKYFIHHRLELENAPFSKSLTLQVQPM